MAKKLTYDELSKKLFSMEEEMTLNEMILQDRKNKMMYEQIAEKYDITEDYVREICGSRFRRIGGVLQKVKE